MRTPIFKHQHIVKLSRLMDMLYKPSEIAEEIGVSVDTVYRSYLPAGLPYLEQDGQFWIHGPAFIAWARGTISQRKNKRKGMDEDHAWCMKCNRPVMMNRPRAVYQNHYMRILQSACPHCGCKVNRAVKGGGHDQ